MDSLELVILHKKRNNDIISDNPLFKMCTITDKGEQDGFISHYHYHYDFCGSE